MGNGVDYLLMNCARVWVVWAKEAGSGKMEIKSMHESYMMVILLPLDITAFTYT